MNAVQEVWRIVVTLIKCIQRREIIKHIEGSPEIGE